MPDSISWNFNAVTRLGAYTKTAGSTDADAVLVARQTVKKKTTANIDLQIADVAKARFFSLTSIPYDEQIVVTHTGGDIHLTGPLVLYGDAIKLFNTSLSTVEIKNNSDGDAEISIMIGLVTA